MLQTMESGILMLKRGFSENKRVAHIKAKKTVCIGECKTEKGSGTRRKEKEREK